MVEKEGVVIPGLSIPTCPYRKRDSPVLSIVRVNGRFWATERLIDSTTLNFQLIK